MEGNGEEFDGRDLRDVGKKSIGRGGGGLEESGRCWQGIQSESRLVGGYLRKR